MNMYQEAYKHLTSRTYKYADKESVYEDLDVLKPLVDKAAPRKMEMFYEHENFKFYKCPICHSIVSLTDRYCSNCGQRVDMIVGDEDV